MKTLAGNFLAAMAGEQAVWNLTNAIQEQLLESPIIKDALDHCDLQPTSRAAWLAADSAVNVILAHEFGQQVGSEALATIEQLHMSNTKRRSEMQRKCAACHLELADLHSQYCNQCRRANGLIRPRRGVVQPTGAKRWN